MTGTTPILPLSDVVIASFLPINYLVWEFTSKTARLLPGHRPRLLILVRKMLSTTAVGHHCLLALLMPSFILTVLWLITFGWLLSINCLIVWYRHANAFNPNVGNQDARVRNIMSSHFVKKQGFQKWPEGSEIAVFIYEGEKCLLPTGDSDSIFVLRFRTNCSLFCLIGIQLFTKMRKYKTLICLFLCWVGRGMLK